MTPEQRAAFVNSRVACMLAELEAMKAANEERLADGMALAYDYKAFSDLPDVYGLGHNAVVSFLIGDK